MVLMYLCVFYEFVLIGICFRSGLVFQCQEKEFGGGFKMNVWPICIFVYVSVAPLSRCWICTDMPNVRNYISVVSLQSEMWQDRKTGVLRNNANRCWAQKQPYIVTTVVWLMNKWLLRASSFKKLHKKTCSLQLVWVSLMNSSQKLIESLRVNIELTTCMEPHVFYL